jgi:hypothetical protein
MSSVLASTNRCKGEFPRRLRSHLLVSARRVIADVLFEGTDFAVQILNAPFQQVANGEHTQQLAIVIDYGKCRK